MEDWEAAATEEGEASGSTRKLSWAALLAGLDAEDEDDEARGEKRKRDAEEEVVPQAEPEPRAEPQVELEVDEPEGPEGPIVIDLTDD